jgi:Zn-dependent peptidase ImmA (M78 family)/DNA-binding XRE family transcriptional regulator
VDDFNREMLILARESRALTQTALAEQAAFSQGEISKFENGLRIPTTEQARRIASHLRYPEGFFYLNEVMRDFGSGCVYHRKRKTAPEIKVRQLLALVNIRRIQIAQLLSSITPTTEYTFELMDVDEFNNAAEVAKALRAIWKLPPGPIQNVVRLIESAGGIVVTMDFGTDKIDALSQWLPGMAPVFLVNQRIPIDRLRFTLMHEVGHIVMHRFPTETMEREADLFAAEFLMPEREIKPQLTGLSLVKLANLKPYWRVSMAALLYRASDVDAINQRTRTYLWMQMGKRGYRKHEPVAIAPEEPTTLKELVRLHRSELGYSSEEVMRIMQLEKAHGLDDLFRDANMPKQGWRIVN